MTVLDLLLAVVLVVTTGAVVVLAMALYGLAGSFASRRMAIWSTGSVPGVSVTDVTPISGKPPAEVAKYLQVLQRYGFRRLGTMRLTPRHGGPLNVWVMVDMDGMHAQLVDIGERPRSYPGSAVCFIATFRDGAALETAYLRGLEVNEPDLKLQVAPSSVDDALFAHRRSVERFAVEHGPPVRIQSMAAYLRWEGDHRARFGEREFAALITYLFEQSVASFKLSLVRVGQALTLLALALGIVFLAKQL
jgi:hypothetical protein